MASSRRIVGFDRKIQLEWLDATADWTAEGIEPPELRERLSQMLEGKVSGSGYRGAREKTITVLMHAWATVPKDLVPLRDDGLALLAGRRGRARLPVHWGMCLATYSFFRDVVETTGRLLNLQGTAALSQVTRRVAESWGERSTVIRATQRVLRSMVDWGVLEERGERGVFSGAVPSDVPDGDSVGAWLVEAAASDLGRAPRPLRSLQGSGMLFPMQLHVSARAVAARPRLAVQRQGLDEVVIITPSGST